MTDENYRLKLEMLRNANARIEFATACANRDLACTGKWQSDWDAVAREAQHDAEDLISEIGDLFT